MNRYIVVFLGYLLGGFALLGSGAKAATVIADEGLAGYGVVKSNIENYQAYMARQVEFMKKLQQEGTGKMKPVALTHKPLDMVANMLENLSGKEGKARTRLAPGKRISDSQKKVAVTAAITAGIDLTWLLRKAEGKREDSNQRTVTTVTRSLINSLGVATNLREAKGINIQARQDIHIVVLASLASGAILRIEEKDSQSIISGVFSSLGLEEEQDKRVTALLAQIFAGEYTGLVRAEMKEQEKKWKEQAQAAFALYRMDDQVTFNAYSQTRRPFYLYVVEKPIDQDENKTRIRELSTKLQELADPLEAMKQKVVYYKSLGFVCSTMVQLQDLVRFISHGQFALEGKDLGTLKGMIDSSPAVKPLVFVGDTFDLKGSGGLDNENKKVWTFIKPHMLSFATQEQMQAESQAFSRVKTIAVAHTTEPIDAFEAWLAANSAQLVQPGNTAAMYQKHVQYHRARVQKEMEIESKLAEYVHAHGQEAIDALRKQFKDPTLSRGLGSQIGYSFGDYAGRADTVIDRIEKEIKTEKVLTELGKALETKATLNAANQWVTSLEKATCFGNDAGYTRAEYLARACAIQAKHQLVVDAQDMLANLEAKDAASLEPVGAFDRWLTENENNIRPELIVDYRARAAVARATITPRAAWRQTYTARLAELKNLHGQEGVKAVEDFLAVVKASEVRSVKDYSEVSKQTFRINVEMEAEAKLRQFDLDFDEGRLSQNEVAAFPKWLRQKGFLSDNVPPYDAASYNARAGAILQKAKDREAQLREQNRVVY